MSFLDATASRHAENVSPPPPAQASLKQMAGPAGWSDTHAAGRPRRGAQCTCASSRPPQKAKPPPGRPGREAPVKGRRHLLPGNPEASGVFSAAVKPGDPSTPQHCEGATSRRTADSRKAMSVLQSPRENARAEISGLCSKPCASTIFFFNPVCNIILLGEKHLSKSPERV